MGWRILGAVAIVVFGAILLDELGWTYDRLAWPLDILASAPIAIAAGALVVPEVERRINRRRGRPTT